MKKFTFSLDKVLTLKRQMLDAIKSELSTLQQGLKKIEEDIEELAVLYERRSMERNEELNRGTTPQTLQFYQQFFSSLRSKEAVLGQRKARQIALIQAKEAEVLTMKSEISGYEKLLDKQLSEYNKKLQKIEEMNIEEFVSNASIRAR